MHFKAILLVFASLFAFSKAEPNTLLIRDVVIVDGTGNAPYEGDVRIRGETIEAIGTLKPKSNETVIEGNGLTLVPGIIDTHSHHEEGLFEEREALAALSQGVTTIVVGQDGFSNFPLSEYFARFDREPATVNLASYVGHGTLRERVMGQDYARQATPAEVRQMEGLLRQELEAGGFGLSTGLEYDPGIYASTDEVVALAKVAASAGRRYMTHIRSEDRYFRSALDEALEIGRHAGIPVHVSHLKLAMRSLWGSSSEVLALLDDARKEGVAVTIDVYPYTYWQSTMTVLFPDRNYEDREAAIFAVTELAPAETIILARYDAQPSLVGKTLVEVAGELGLDAADALIELIRRSEAHRRADPNSKESIIATSMHEDDVKTFMLWPHANVASDGYLTELHPRGRGAFPRFLGRYVRDDELMSFAAGIHKVTGLAAEHVGIVDRGRVAPGMKADLVLLDPTRLIDRATPDDPFALSRGVDTVIVNGIVVYADGKATGRYPGQIVRAPVFKHAE